MIVTSFEGDGCALLNLTSVNIIMGRNGAGKSRFLRTLDQFLHQSGGYNVRYVSPERAGSFVRDGNILTNMSNNPTFLRDTRAVNQATQFKPGSAMLLREAETLYLRKITKTPELRMDLDRSFETDRLDKINRLLTNVSLAISPTDFEFRTLGGEPVTPTELSSGESETVSLATEILYFFDTLSAGKFNVLLLDEPDVHLHPDLQARLAHLIIEMLDEYQDQRDNIAICIATHSAPFVCAVATSDYVSLGTKSFGNQKVELRPSSSELKKIAPFFGHPLSLALSEDVPLIVEGEDDERVWQQAARSAQGKLKLFPVLATSVDQQGRLETFAQTLLSTLYDYPIAFSIRDGDGVVGQPIQHLTPVKRYRLECYAIENLLLTDQCLEVLKTDWSGVLVKGAEWLASNEKHKDAPIVEQLINSKDRLRHVKIKSIRQLVCTFCGSGKPWEVVVGQAIAQVPKTATSQNNMLIDFFGQTGFNEIVAAA